MFQGFPNSGFTFLKELKAHNTRDWFLENKKRYEQEIKIPSKMIVEEMGDVFHRLDLPYLAHPNKSLFRINRDTRFSNDKTPYKTHIGITFPYQSKDGEYSIATKTEKPGLYLHIEPSACFIAGGLYMPDATQLRNIRSALDLDWQLLHKASHSKTLLNEFPEGLQGEKLKTMPRGYTVDHPGKEYLRMKQFLLMESISQKEVQSSNLIYVLEKKAKAMAPIMEFLSLAIMD